MGHIQNDVHNTEMSVIWPWIGEGSSRWAARRKSYTFADTEAAAKRNAAVGLTDAPVQLEERLC